MTDRAALLIGSLLAFTFVRREDLVKVWGEALVRRQIKQGLLISSRLGEGTNAVLVRLSDDARRRVGAPRVKDRADAGRGARGSCLAYHCLAQGQKIVSAQAATEHLGIEGALPPRRYEIHGETVLGLFIPGRGTPVTATIRAICDWYAELLSRPGVKAIISSGRIRAEVIYTRAAKQKAKALHLLLGRAKGVQALARDDLKPRTQVLVLEL